MKPSNPLEKLIANSLSGGLPIFILVLSLLLGALALNFTAREEEPQIVVPMVDILVEAPGLSAKQIERQVTTPLEKLLAQIPGVENVYSTSQSDRSSVTLRFFVGEEREASILNTYNKLYSNQDKMPGVISTWMVSPVEVDDVPILMLALWSDRPDITSDFELRRLADEVSTYLQAIDNTSEVNVVGGRPRVIQILPSPEGLAARQSTSSDIINALQVSNVLQSAGRWTLNRRSFLLESGDFIRDVTELKQTVINVVDGQPVFLNDVAEIVDGPSEPNSYSWLDFSPTHPSYMANQGNFPMVAISVAKQGGSNAVKVAEDVHDIIGELKKSIFPSDVHVEVLRDYGQTANEKVNNLTSSLAFAVVTVVIFIAVFLGWRPALVVGIAVPISYGITLALDMVFGYTINRVTLFALILSLGLLVDDPITGVDNIERFLKERTGSVKDRIVAAISEIRTPLLMSTITIVLAFIPLVFISGMMGPYMAPLAFNVPVSVAISTVVAFVVTPWLASKILRAPNKTESDDINNRTHAVETGLLKNYRKILGPLLNDRRKSKIVLWSVLVLFVGAAMLPMLRLVPLKLLPFDNKNEIQVLIDLPESATLEETAALTEKVSKITQSINEVQAVASFVGAPSPIDFNGMVRRHYQRVAPYTAELRVTLIDKALREHQSHGVVLRLRKMLRPLNTNGIVTQVIEVPPGPPVLSTLVAEVYGSNFTPYEDLQVAARKVKNRLQREAFVTEVDTTVEDDHQRFRFVTDKQKSALSGISTRDITQTLVMANQGLQVGFMHVEREAQPLPMIIRLPFSERSTLNDLLRLPVKGRPGIVKQSSRNGLESAPQPLVALGEIGKFRMLAADTSIHHKDLRPVVYVMAELEGRTPAEVIADVNADLGVGDDESTENNIPNDWRTRTFLASGGGDEWLLAKGIDVVWTGEGEWRITVDVFIDMGLAFMFALACIFLVLKVQTRSTSLSLIIMSAIPLTIIGIMPGFWVLNQFGEREIVGAPEPVLFTATAMIGMIALAGIVVRNSLILVEFITQARDRGVEIKEALIQAGSMRMRPILLTAGTTLLGNLIITLDPVFSGLALAIIFGIIASTLFTLLVVPIVYLLVFEDSQQT